LLEGPARGLFDLMVVAAQGREVAQAGLAAGLVGEGVVWLALGGGTPAGALAAVDMQDLAGDVDNVAPVAVAARPKRRLA
jgi:hypothetical protein